MFIFVKKIDEITEPKFIFGEDHAISSAQWVLEEKDARQIEDELARKNLKFDVNLIEKTNLLLDSSSSKRLKRHLNAKLKIRSVDSIVSDFILLDQVFKFLIFILRYNQKFILIKI